MIQVHIVHRESSSRFCFHEPGEGRLPQTDIGAGRLRHVVQYKGSGILDHEPCRAIHDRVGIAQPLIVQDPILRVVFGRGYNVSTPTGLPR